MHLTIISLPAGENLASLYYPLEADEISLGRSETCQIRLPDHRQNIKSREAVLSREDNSYSLQVLGEHSMKLNGTCLSPDTDQQVLLSDGDIITCGCYQLVFSNFTPWKSVDTNSPSSFPVEKRQIENASNLTPDTYSHHSESPLYDPFEEIPVNESAKIESNAPDDSDIPQQYDSDIETDFLSDEPDNKASPLIDLLEDQSIDNSTHRELWLEDPTHYTSSDLLLPFEEKQQKTSNNETIPTQLPIPVNAAIPRSNDSHWYAVLQALDQTLNDLSTLPDLYNNRYNPEYALPKKTLNTHMKNYFYSVFQRCCRLLQCEEANENKPLYPPTIMNKRYHRTLFIQHFREALKRQD